MVPKGWRLGTLSSLADTVMGYAFKSTDFVPDGVPLLRMGNLYQNTLSFDRSPVYLPSSYKESFSRFLVKSGDLVMSMTGTMGKRDYGFTVQIHEDAPYSLLNQRVLKFIPKKNTSSGYLLNLLRSELILSRLYSFPGGTKQANLSAKQVQELPAFLPPLPEQNKIAQILSAWDKAIATTKQLLANSQQQKTALIQQLLTGKKRFPRFSDNWEMIELEKLYFFKKGKGLSKSAISGAGKKKCVLYGELYTKYGEVITDVYSRTDAVDGLVSLAGDILIPSSTTTSSIDLANVTAILEDGVLLGGDINVLRPKNILDAIFMAHLLTHIKKYDIASRAQGITIIHLYSSDLKDLEVFIPKQTLEQRKITSVLTAADSEINAMQQKLDCLQQEKKALMRQLLTGKRRVIP
jgi:type I restriction enzyme S subunit